MPQLTSTASVPVTVLTVVVLVKMQLLRTLATSTSITLFIGNHSTSLTIYCMLYTYRIQEYKILSSWKFSKIVTVKIWSQKFDQSGTVKFMHRPVYILNYVYVL